MPRQLYQSEAERAVARKESNRKYYEKVRETRLAKQKEYDQAHKEIKRSKDKLRNEANKQSTI
jgi:hypothetical protein